jgi:predicted outer membrane repeat protein
MISIDPLRAGITCENDSEPRFIFNTVRHVHVRNLKFFECIGDKQSSLMARLSSLALVNCVFENNGRISNYMIKAANSNITIAQSTFKDNVIRYEMITFIYCNVTIVNSTFINNDCDSLLTVSNLSLVYQYHELGSIAAIASTSTITGCEFRNNHQQFGGMIHVYNSDALLIYDTKFVSNGVEYVLQVTNTVTITENSTFVYNRGSAMHLTLCEVNIINSVFNNNEACALESTNNIIHIRGSEFKGNVEEYGKGGAMISSGKTVIRFSEICTFADNRAKQGGAIYLDNESILQWFVAYGATVMIASNTAIDGGGIYLSDYANLTIHSQSTLHILNNRATKNGGGIYASKYSSINLGFKSLKYISQTWTSNSTNIHFYRNQAKNGGGLYLELNSIVYIFKFPCLNNITWLGKWLKNKPFRGTSTEQQISLVVQGKKNDEPVTYSEVAPPAREEENEPLSDSNNLTNRTNALSESVGYEENELRPIKHKVTDSSTPYLMMIQK